MRLVNVETEYCISSWRIRDCRETKTINVVHRPLMPGSDLGQALLFP